MLTGLEYQHLLCATVDMIVKLLNISTYIVLYDSEQSQLTNTVQSLWHNAKVDGFAFDKLHLVVAPTSDDTATRKEDLLVKSVLFDFLISASRQL